MVQVLVMTDDMDGMLGSWEHSMTQSTALLKQRGATAENFFIHTPVCCPSRAETLSGRYFHNLRNVDNATGKCMGVDVQAS